MTSLIQDVFRLMGEGLQHPRTFSFGRASVLGTTFPVGKSRQDPAEFGVKVHMLQIDGINIIEHYNYSANNECKRVASSIALHGRLFGACHQFSGDRIYATNANRKHLTAKNIAKKFVQKGKGDGEEKKTLRALLNKERSTWLEGSFGHDRTAKVYQK